MRKIGLLTLDSRSYNYGGLLQEYALQKTVVRLGYQCEIIDYDMSSELGMFSYKRSLLYLTPEKIFSKLKVKTKENKDISKVIIPRHERFDEFRSEYIKLSSRCRYSDLIEMQNKYHSIVCGSDQIWSPSLTRPSFFLDFVDATKKKIIYAASISRDQLSKKEAKVYKRYLSSFESVSVREEKAKEIIHGLIPSMDVNVVLDPTFLLDHKDWEKIAGKQALVDEAYLFCYFLNIDEQKREAAIKFAKKNGLRIVSLPCLPERYNSLDEGFSEDLFPTKPAEFLNLILHAEFVLTDSFHPSVFSIVFNKNFRVFERSRGKQNMNSRLETLLSYVKHREFLVSPERIESCNTRKQFSFNYEIIKEKKDMSIDYLLSKIGGETV